MKHLKVLKRGVLVCTMLLQAGCSASTQAADEQWFETFKKEASDRELYRFLYAMPKGGDLHNHMSGNAFPEWWYELALEQRENGYRYYTKVTINNCKPYGHHEFSGAPYKMYFRNVMASTYEAMSDCQKSEYKRLGNLTKAEKEGWLDSIRLDSAEEGRDEFFQRHWQRLDELTANPYLMAEILYRNMEAFGNEGLIYLESMMASGGFMKPDGSTIPRDRVADIYRERLNQADAEETGVTVRLQESILRFAPNAEQQLRADYEFVSDNRDLYVAVNMVGREDNDKGYPMRFRETLRDLRRDYSDVNLSIHAGELDEPNTHIRNTLTLGADRIGHGIQLINDPDLMRELRHGPYLIEINLISNLLLEYVDDYSEHPFPEYLRIGVPVALSTDDRGMWDSNLTDEFFVAVREFDLSWSEIQKLSLNSIRHGFLEPSVKQSLVTTYEKRLANFEQGVREEGTEALNNVEPVVHGFVCRHYELCEPYK